MVYIIMNALLYADGTLFLVFRRSRNCYIICE